MGIGFGVWPPGVHEDMVRAATAGAAPLNTPETPAGRAALVAHARTLMPDADQATWEALVRSALTAVGANTVCAKQVVLAAASGDEARLWDPSTGRHLGTFRGHRRPLRTVMFVSLPGGAKLLATASLDGTARLWDPTSFESVRSIDESGVRALNRAFLPPANGGPVLATGSPHGSIGLSLWSQRPAPEPRGRKGFGVQGDVPSAGSTHGDAPPTGRPVALSSVIADDTSRLWDASTGDALRELTALDQVVSSMVIEELPDGSPMLWTAANGQPPQRWQSAKHMTLRGHTDAVTALAFGVLPNGHKILASASNDRTARLWDARTGASLGCLNGHTRRVISLAFGSLADGYCVLATGSADGQVMLWDPRTGKHLRTLSDHPYWVDSIAFGTVDEAPASALSLLHARPMPTDKRLKSKTDDDQNTVVLPIRRGTRVRLVLATASQDGTAQLWDPTTGENLRTFAGHSAGVNAVAFAAPDDRTTLLATGSNDCTVRLWNPITGVQLRALSGHSDRVTSVAFGTLRDGTNLLATGSADHTAKLWDATNGVLLRTLVGHTGAVSCVTVGSVPGLMDFVATTSADGTVRIWNLVTGGHVLALAASSLGLTSVAFHVARKRFVSLAVGCQEGTAQLWAGRLGGPRRAPWHKPPSIFGGKRSTVESMAFGSLPNGAAVLAAACDDHTTQLWEPAKGIHLGSLAGHTGSVTSVAFDAQPGASTLVATASQDRTVRLWNPVNRIHLRTLSGHTAPVESVAFGIVPVD